MKWTAFVLLLFVYHADAFTGCYHGSVRLIDSTYYGRVEVCIGGEWGTVCNYGWDNNDAAVVCRQLGFETIGASTYSGSAGNGAIYLKYVNCKGTELSLFQCDYQYPRADYYPCTHSYDAGVSCLSTQCQHGNVRLSGGATQTEGNVELCVSGQWNGLCGSSLTYQDAFVVCRKLGLPATSAEANSYRYSQYPIIPTYSYYIYCYGYESRLTDCATSSYGSCDLSSRVGVSCRGQTMTGTCNGSTVRLVGGKDQNEGRVEICSNDVWGTVSAYSWDSREGQIVCRQLGYYNADVYVYNYNTFGQGSGPVLFVYLNCVGTEASLSDCSSSSYGYYYDHSNDAGLRCQNHTTNDGCQPGSVQLTGGTTAREGRIELCVQTNYGYTVWGSLCNVYSSGVAEVVCRQLNYSRSGAVLYSVAPFGSSQRPFVLDSVSCTGTESNLQSCSLSYSIGVHRCHGGQESGVTCKESCVEGSVQLTGGYTSTEGRLEMCISGSWTSISHSNYWNSNTVNVACVQLFGSVSTATAIYNSAYGYGTGSVVVTYMYCFGNEKNLTSCSYSTSTGFSHSYDVGVRCYGYSTCVEGQVQLVNGSTAYEGRVEVCRNGVWVAIYDSGWTTNDAMVVCRQLGYPYQWAIPLGGTYFGKGSTLLELYNIICTGSESSLSSCSNTSLSRGTNSIPYFLQPGYISSTGNAGVMCLGSATVSTECFSGEVRLVGGPSDAEGRVELCKNGFWSTVCYSGVNQIAGLIVCNSLGLNATGVVISSGVYPKRTGPVIAGISCTGSESHVRECTSGSIGTYNCGHDKDLNLKCLTVPAYYYITVGINPSSGPFKIGSSVNLTCQLSPMLQGVIYSWRAAFPNSPTYPNNPNITVTIMTNHPKVAHHYCTVKLGTSTIGVGKVDIAVQSLIVSSNNSYIQFKPPQAIVLSVNITDVPAAKNFRLLSWFFGGQFLSPSDRVILNQDNTTLIIKNTQASDAGVYEVKFMGLITSPRDEIWEHNVLNVMRTYPVFSGLSFVVSLINFSHTGSMFGATVIPMSIGSPLTVQVVWTLPTVTPCGSGPSCYANYYSTQWYYNGQIGSIPSGARLSSTKYGQLSLAQNLTIDRVNVLSAGYLDAQVVLNTYTYLCSITNDYCPYQYYYFIRNLNIYTVVLDASLVSLAYFTRPRISITFNHGTVYTDEDKAIITDGKNVDLTCSSAGGYPLTIAVSWTKGGDVIATGNTQQTISTSLQTSPYGRYVCSADNSVAVTSREMLLKGQGALQLLLQFTTSHGCSGFSNAQLQMKATSITSNILAQLLNLCYCNVNESDFESTSTICTMDGQALMYATSIAYTSDAGDITGATLVNQLYASLFGNKFSTITIDGEPFQAQQVLSKSDNAGPIAGAFFGGLCMAILAIGIAATVAYFYASKKRSKHQGALQHEAGDNSKSESKKVDATAGSKLEHNKYEVGNSTSSTNSARYTPKNKHTLNTSRSIQKNPVSPHKGGLSIRYQTEKECIDMLQEENYESIRTDIGNTDIYEPTDTL